MDTIIAGLPMKKICLLLVILCGLLSSGCRQEQQAEPEAQTQPLLIIGSRLLSVDQFKREFKAAYPQAKSLAQDERLLLEGQLIKQLIERELIFGEAARLNVSYTPDELDAAMAEVRGQLTQEQFSQLLAGSNKTPENWTKSLKLQLLTSKVIAAVLEEKIQIGEEDAENYYLTHKQEFTRPEEIRARQMLFSTREDALKVLTRLNKGENFAALAKEVSLSPDSEDGGSLGYFARGQLPKEFDQVLFKLPLRHVSDPVESPYGYHLFLVERRRNAGLRPYAAVKDEIITKLRQEKEEQVFHQWLDQLQKTTQITVDWDLLNTP
jgi:parvulin-like peptidyl-prolyl isomerase